MLYVLSMFFIIYFFILKMIFDWFFFLKKQIVTIAFEYEIMASW